jgi:hypothetical protein
MARAAPHPPHTVDHKKLRARVWEYIQQMPVSCSTTCSDLEVLQSRPRDWYQPDKVWTARPKGLSTGNGSYRTVIDSE